MSSENELSESSELTESELSESSELTESDNESKVTPKKQADKFYTKPNIVDLCIDEFTSKIGWKQWKLVIEPSAGCGNFLEKIPVSEKIGIDIYPEHKDVIKMDFYDYIPEVKNNILVIGNPPFGRVSSGAIKFFNHASKWADMIAFIVPRTFRRIAIQNKLNLHFHLVHDIDIPLKPCSFTPKMMAKCCFQIWKKKSLKRKIIKLKMKHSDWDFLPFGKKDKNNQPTPPTGADFALLAYGGKCGRIVTDDLQELRPKSWHWIKSKIPKNTLIERFESLNYDLSKNTARQNSIGKGELIKLYEEKYN